MVQATRARVRPWAPSLAGVVGLAFFVWGLSLGLEPLGDNSFLTHLATGRLIVDDGIPRTDPYSFTAPGAEWVVQSWLASWVYGLADDWWGSDGLRLLVGLLTGALAAMVWALTRPARSLVARIGVGALVVGVGVEAWSERPLLIGLVCLALLLLAAEGRMHPAWVVPVMWLWVNTHGSFPLGLVALGSFALGRYLDGERPTTELRVLAYAAGGTLLGAFNPLGPRLLWFPIELLERSDVLRLVTEWMSPNFTTLPERLFLVLVVASVVALVRRPRYRAAIPLVVFAAAALLAVRNIGVAAVVLAPGLAAGLEGLGTVEGGRRSRLVTGIGALLVVVALLVTVARLDRPGFDLDRYPTEAVGWLDDEGLLDGDTRVVTRDFVGNYLEFRFGPRRIVFFDDRFDMYPEELTRDYADLVRGGESLEVLDRYDAEVVLWDLDTPLGQALAVSPEWDVAYEDDDWLVACRRSAGACASGG